MPSVGVTFTVPWPPTANHLFPTAMRRRKDGRMIQVRTMSKDGEEYRLQVGKHVMVQRVPRHTLSGRLEVWLRLYPPRGYNTGDIANREKALIDALQHCAVIQNDEHIDRLHILRELPAPPHGRVEVTIQEIPGAATESKTLFEETAA